MVNKNQLLDFKILELGVSNQSLPNSEGKGDPGSHGLGMGTNDGGGENFFSFFQVLLNAQR